MGGRVTNKTVVLLLLVRLGQNRTVVLVTLLPMPITLIMSSSAPKGGERRRGVSAGQIDPELKVNMVVAPAVMVL